MGSSVGLADRDAELLAVMCKSGARFANASEADLAALRTAFAPVYASLEQDPETKAFIEQIQALKRSTPAGAPLAIPAGCTGVAPAAPAAAQQQAAGDLSGTYRWTITKEDVLPARRRTSRRASGHVPVDVHDDARRRHMDAFPSRGWPARHGWPRHLRPQG